MSKVFTLLIVALMPLLTFAKGGFRGQTLVGVTQTKGELLSHAIAIDARGDALIAGAFSGEVDLGGKKLKSAGHTDAFIAKYSEGRLVFAVSAGGPAEDGALDIAVDTNGFAYVIGTFGDGAVFGEESLASESGSDTFVWKLKPDSSTAWTQALKASGGTQAGAIAVDPKGKRIVVGGSFRGTLRSKDVIYANAQSDGEAFLVAFDELSEIRWSHFSLGFPDSSSMVRGLAYHPQGAIAVVGDLEGTMEFAGRTLNAEPGYRRSFVSSFTIDKGEPGFLHVATSRTDSIAASVATIADGRIFVAGRYRDKMSFGNKAVSGAPNAHGYYLLALDSSGTAAFLQDLGATAPTSSTQTLPSISTSPFGAVVVAAAVQGTVKKGRFELRGAGRTDVLVQGFDASGILTRADSYGGSQDDSVGDVAVSPTGSINLTGTYQRSIGFDETSIVEKPFGVPGTKNIFVARLAPVRQLEHVYDGSEKSQPSYFIPRGQSWIYQGLFENMTIGAFGASTDLPVPGDYSGTGFSQAAVYRPSTAQWFVREVSGATRNLGSFGGPNFMDIPVPADYFAIGLTQPAVFRPATGEWFVKTPVGSRLLGTLGEKGDIPAPGDYDGVGYAQMAVFRPATAEWLVKGADGVVRKTATFGAANLMDIPVAGDYENLGRTQPAVFRRSTRQWFVLGAKGGRVLTVFGTSNLNTSLPINGLPGALKVLGSW